MMNGIILPSFLCLLRAASRLRGKVIEVVESELICT